MALVFDIPWINALAQRDLRMAFISAVRDPFFMFVAVQASRASVPAAADPVEIGYLTGEARTCALAGPFAPTTTELVVELERGVRSLMQAERIAYVAFHRRPGELRPALGDGPKQRLRIRAGGKDFTVEVFRDSTKSALGFRGVPIDDTSPFREIYFYSHGVLDLVEGFGEEAHAKSVRRRQQSSSAPPSSGVRNAPPSGLESNVDFAPPSSAYGRVVDEQLIESVLLEAGLVTAEGLESARHEQTLRKGKRLTQILVEAGQVREAELTNVLGAHFGLGVVDLDQQGPTAAAIAIVPRDVIVDLRILPVAFTSGRLVVATPEPLAAPTIAALTRRTKQQIDQVLVLPSQLDRFIEDHLKKTETVSGGAVPLDQLLRDLKAEDVTSEIDGEDEDPREKLAGVSADVGVIGVVNEVILDACRRGASDIHVEPNGKRRDVTIRFRIDGDCVAYQSVPATHRNQLVARIKIMAGLDIAEHRKPQDGKIRFRAGDHTIELRVATLPTANGNEDVVLRILANAKPQPLDRLGLSPRNLDQLRRAIMRPYGLLLCVGPTGSGKTTTLHSALGAINTEDRKIWTAEDPVEITQVGLRQMQINPKIGLTFATAMRAFLRADPDVIMVGEMRDGETASTAIEASLTGHLVLSTLHTNTAPDAVTRLLDMGMDPFCFADSLIAVLAQRLARALCRKCRVQRDASSEELAEVGRAFEPDEFEMLTMGGLPIWHATGCADCGNSGYKGRIALHEMLVMNPTLHHAVGHREPIAVVRKAAIEGGMSTMFQDGVSKALRGETDLKQVAAVCGGK